MLRRGYVENTTSGSAHKREELSVSKTVDET
jgi:hypothetical protein